MSEHSPVLGQRPALTARAHFGAAAYTLRNLRRDFVEWHRGRERYALWAIDVDLPAVVERVAAADRHLAGLLLDGYRRQPHITLGLCGFPQARPRLGDDFGPAALVRQLARLRAEADGPFEIAVGGLSSFTSAPFLEVEDSDGGIARLHRSLADGEINRRDGSYTPHVTVGLYGGAWPVAAVLARLDAFAGAAPLTLRVERVSLMSYGARDIGGPLLCAAQFELASGRLHLGDIEAAGFDAGFFAAAVTA